MKPLIKLIMRQELIYCSFLLIIGLSVAYEHGLYIGIKAFFFCFLFMQIIILMINWKIISKYFKTRNNWKE